MLLDRGAFYVHRGKGIKASAQSLGQSGRKQNAAAFQQGDSADPPCLMQLREARLEQVAVQTKFFAGAIDTTMCR